MNADEYNKQVLAKGIEPEDLTRLTKIAQAALRFPDAEVDGKYGPGTAAAVARFFEQPLSKLETAGRTAIERAFEWWKADIYDPKVGDGDGRTSRDYIDHFIRKGLGWTWEPPYAGDGAFEWCGAFAAACWHTVKPELRRTYFASTYRLDRFARYQSVNGEANGGSGRLLAEFNENSHTRPLPFAPMPGDILLIGPTGSGFGKHITLVESFDSVKKVFHTIEGNGNGQGPTGRTRQGVVRASRVLGGPTWHARRLIRPSVEDLI